MHVQEPTFEFDARGVFVDRCVRLVGSVIGRRETPDDSDNIWLPLRLAGIIKPSVDGGGAFF